MRCFFIALVLALAATPAAAQRVTLVPDEYTLSFRISAPSGWDVRRDQSSMRWVAVSRPTEAGDTFRENLNVVTEGLAQPMALAAYVRAQVALLEQNFGEFRLLEQEERVIAGQPAVRIIYEHTFRDWRVRVVTYAFVLGNRGYALTGSAEADRFDEYLPIFEAMANSFRL